MYGKGLRPLSIVTCIALTGAFALAFFYAESMESVETLVKQLEDDEDLRKAAQELSFDGPIE